jgi:single-strand DNA-binding protein
MKTYGEVRLANKPTLREVGTQKVSNFRVCSDRAYKRKNAVEFSHELMFIDVTAWGPLAERVAAKLNTGDKVLLEGELRMRSYESTKHGKVTVHEIKASNVKFLASPKPKAPVKK